MNDTVTKDPAVHEALFGWTCPKCGAIGMDLHSDGAAMAAAELRRDGVCFRFGSTTYECNARRRR